MTGAPTNGEGLGILARLRRRKVVQWGLGYGAAAWGLLQGIAYLVTTFHWPESVQQLATLLLLTGLPVVAVLAWYHGDRGHQRVTGSELAVLAVLLLAGGGILWRYSERAVETPRAGPGVSTSREAADAAARPSVAVLPFEDRSSREDDAYFVDGIHDDILTQLSKVGALRVISRTSVERYRDTELPIGEVARQLGVSSILEGGVQRAGERVRINVQLIDAATDAHVWAETYDRELTAANMFAIQSELAAAIATALRTTLTPAEKARVDAMPTASLEAWEAYQFGRHRQRAGTSEGLREAESFFRKAIGLDPQFALAYVGLSESLFYLAYRGSPHGETLEKSRLALERARALAPDLSEMHAMAGKLAESRGEYADAEEAYLKAIELNANNATALLRYSGLLPGFGRQQDAVRFAERAVQLDPLSIPAQVNLGNTLAGVGRFDDAVAAFRKAAAIDPKTPAPCQRLARTYALGYGRFDEAVRWQRKLVELEPDSPGYRAELAGMYLDLGDADAAQRWLEDAMRDGVRDATTAETAALFHLYRGEDALAQDFARRAAEITARFGQGLQLLRMFDLAAGDPLRARDRYAQVVPELLASEVPKIDGTNFLFATDLALVLQRTGEAQRASELLEGSLRFAELLPRMGFLGSNMAYVQILALQGRKAAALDALRALVQAGYAESWRYYRDFDPNVAAIRNEPEFQAAFAEIERRMAQQRARLVASVVPAASGS